MVRFLVIFLLFLLAGCTTPPDKLTMNERKQIYRDNQQKLAFLHQWQMSGRIALHYERGGDALNVDWIQYYRDYGIKLSGPMNIGAAYLIGNKDGVTYKDGKGHEDHAPSPEAILQAYTGYLLPISSLRYWLIGMPDPTMLNDMTLNPQGYPITMRQGPWTVQFGYFRQVGEYMLPHKLSMNHKNFAITLTIYDWELKNLAPVSGQYKSNPVTSVAPPRATAPAFEMGTDMAVQDSGTPTQASTNSSTLKKASGKKPKSDNTSTPTQSTPTVTSQHDPSTGSSVMGQSFPPKKTSKPMPIMSTSQDSEPIEYRNETSGTDMTDTSMHP